MAGGGPAIRLHDVIREYLRHDMGAAGCTARNRDFLGVARQLLGEAPDQDGAGRLWWLLPPDARYLWQNLAYHLHEAGAAEELAVTVCDLRWIEAKINVTGSVAAVEADLALEDSDTARLLARVLGRSSSLFTPAEPRSALGATLVSRLDGTPGLESVVGSYAEALTTPRLGTGGSCPTSRIPLLSGTSRATPTGSGVAPSRPSEGCWPRRALTRRYASGIRVPVSCRPGSAGTRPRRRHPTPRRPRTRSPSLPLPIHLTARPW